LQYWNASSACWTITTKLEVRDKITRTLFAIIGALIGGGLGIAVLGVV